MSMLRDCLVRCDVCVCVGVCSLAVAAVVAADPL